GIQADERVTMAVKSLIVSADDFGIAKGINEGIAIACKEGIVTNINVMPSGDEFYDSLARLKDIAPSEIGAHLALTGTAPLADPGKVSSLLDKGGHLHKNYGSFFINFISGRIKREEIYVELKTQMDRLKSVGIPVTNLSSHEHIHLHPDILEIFIAIAEDYNIPAIRYIHRDVMACPVGFKKLYKKAVLAFFGIGHGNMIKKSGLKHTDILIGLLDSGNLEEETLLKMLKAMPEGTAELVAHPGLLSPEVLNRCVFHARCETDLASLISGRVKKLIGDKGIQLIKFSALSYT
ncbi:YdjC-like protein, partial [sediment metagenome]